MGLVVMRPNNFSMCFKERGLMTRERNFSEHKIAIGAYFTLCVDIKNHSVQLHQFQDSKNFQYVYFYTVVTYTTGKQLHDILFIYSYRSMLAYFCEVNFIRGINHDNYFDKSQLWNSKYVISTTSVVIFKFISNCFEWLKNFETFTKVLNHYVLEYCKSLTRIDYYMDVIVQQLPYYLY